MVNNRLSVPAKFSMLFAVLIAGCNQAVPETKQDTAAVSALTAKLSEAEKELQALKQRVWILELSKDAYKVASFDPTGEKSYSRVDSNVGNFLVVLDNVEPYLDGQRISLMIGNPNNVTYSGADLKVGWSSRFPDYTLPQEKFAEGMKKYNETKMEKDIKLTDTLRPGTWNKVSFTIAPAKSADFGNLTVSITTNQVFLAGGR